MHALVGAVPVHDGSIIGLITLSYADLGNPVPTGLQVAPSNGTLGAGGLLNSITLVAARSYPLQFEAAAGDFLGGLSGITVMAVFAPLEGLSPDSTAKAAVGSIPSSMITVIIPESHLVNLFMWVLYLLFRF